MAKSKSTSKGNKGTKMKEIDFSKLNDMLGDISDQGVIASEEDLNVGTISTGIYILNAAISGSIYGGVASDRISAFAGVSGTSKTYLCMNIVKEAIKDGYNIIYIDTEKAIDRYSLEKFNIDTSKVRIERISLVEDLRSFFAKFLDKMKGYKKEGTQLPKIMIVLDSMGMLGSRKEVDDAIEGNTSVDMTRGKSIRSLFRVISNDLGLLGIPMIMTNHTYMTLGKFPQEVFAGGEGGIYSASTIMMLSKAKLKTGDEGELDMQSGITVTAKASKNRMAIPKKVKFEIAFAGGSNLYKGLEFFCTPENFERVGIAKGKMVDGEFKPGGNKYYVRHLEKSFWEKQLFTEDIFNKEVLDAIDEIVQMTFQYQSPEQMLEIEKQLKEDLTKMGLISDNDSDDSEDSDEFDLFGDDE